MKRNEMKYNVLRYLILLPDEDWCHSVYPTIREHHVPRLTPSFPLLTSNGLATRRVLVVRSDEPGDLIREDGPVDQVRPLEGLIDRLRSGLRQVSQATLGGGIRLTGLPTGSRAAGGGLLRDLARRERDGLDDGRSYCVRTGSLGRVNERQSPY